MRTAASAAALEGPGPTMIRLRGGYNVLLTGRPDRAIERLPEPAALRVPLRSRRFAFTEVRVRDGDRVRAGGVLAVDPANSAVPLLAPRAGTVRLGRAEGHVTLESLGVPEAEASAPAGPPGPADASGRRGALVALGAWPFLECAHTGRPPDPARPPRAVLVSTMRLEPFLARGDALLRVRLEAFLRGLERLQSLLEYEPIYLVMPDVSSALAEEVRERLRGLAWLQVVTVRRTYPHDDFAVLARGLGLMRDPARPVWGLRTEGVLALERALGEGRPVTDRVISLGGPAAARPRHVEVPVGYPLEALAAEAAGAGPVRRIAGGALTGRALGPEDRGLDAECAGLTLLAEPGEREFLGWLRPGRDRRSYGRCFLSALGAGREEAVAAALRGERRACIACGQCADVCPARILPHALHKALYRGGLDDAARLRIDLCVRCGLCAYVCPSKLDLLREFVEAQETLRREREEVLG